MESREDHPPNSGLAIRLLGPLLLERDGTPVTIGAKKGAALLAILCLRRGHYAPRDTLIGILWGDSAEEQARASLRQTLSGLRTTLGPANADILTSDANGLSLAGPRVWMDMSIFDRLSRDDDLASLKMATELFRGELLEGFPALSPEFDRWLDAERGIMRTRVIAVFLRLSDAAEKAGDTEGAMAAAHKLLVLDPLQEHVHRRLMRAYLLQKRHDAALRQFDMLKTLLKTELGESPDPETLDLFREIRRQRAAPTAAKPAPARSDAVPVRQPAHGGGSSGRPSVAVLPFKSLTATEDATLFGEAISEEIIVELARETALLVVSRASSFQFNLAESDASTIGRDLGVRFLLGGSVRIAGEKVRVTAHLVQCEDERQIWAERHDRELRDLFDIQTDIARTVTATVVGRIADAEAEATHRRPFEGLESYSLAAKGYRHFLSYSKEGYTAAFACFERAVALDPDFARAWGLLALLGIYQRWYFEMRTDVAEFINFAEKAIQLDPRDAKGHCALGLAHLILRQYDKAGFHYEAGLRANPNDDLLLIEYGRFLMYVELPEDGLRQVAEAMRINPLHPNWYWNIQGRCLHMLGRTQEALNAFQKIHAPTFWIYSYIASCQQTLGNKEAADGARKVLFRLRPDFDLSDFVRTFPYKNEETARRFIEDLGLGF